jgi:hypothetical protein
MHRNVHSELPGLGRYNETRTLATGQRRIEIVKLLDEFGDRAKLQGTLRHLIMKRYQITDRTLRRDLAEIRVRGWLYREPPPRQPPLSAQDEARYVRGRSTELWVRGRQGFRQLGRGCVIHDPISLQTKYAVASEAPPEAAAGIREYDPECQAVLLLRRWGDGGYSTYTLSQRAGGES